jgi:hypothetical protein
MHQHAVVHTPNQVLQSSNEEAVHINSQMLYPAHHTAISISNDYAKEQKHPSDSSQPPPSYNEVMTRENRK